MHQKVYLFDVDGTLTNTAHIWVEIYEAGLRDLGIAPPNAREIAKYTHNFATATVLGVKKAQLAAFAKNAWRRADERVHAAALHDAAFEVLARLRARGHKTGVVSSMYQLPLERTLRERGIVVDVVVGSAEGLRTKPHPDGILLALQKLGVPPNFEHVTYYGDKDTDIMAARAAGIRAVHFFPAAHAELYDLDAMSVEPDERLTHWNELLAQL